MIEETTQEQAAAEPQTPPVEAAPPPEAEAPPAPPDLPPPTFSEENAIEVDGELVDITTYLTAQDKGMDHRAAVEAAKVTPPGEEAEEEPVPFDTEEAAEAPAAEPEPEAPAAELEALDAELVEDVTNRLLRSGWTSAQIEAGLADPAQREFVLDQAERVRKTQAYITKLREGAADADSQEDIEPDSSSNAAPKPGHPADEGPAVDLSRLTEFLDDETAGAVSQHVETAVRSAREQTTAEVREALDPLRQLLVRQIRREVGEQFPELMESNAAWQRVAERADALSTTRDFDDPFVGPLVAAAEELRFQRTEAAQQRTRRARVARSADVATTPTNSQGADPITSDEAWTRYFEAWESGDEREATRMNALFHQLREAES